MQVGGRFTWVTNQPTGGRGRHAFSWLAMQVFVFVELGTGACARVAPIEGGGPRIECPSLRAVASNIDLFGSTTLQEGTCRAEAFCAEGPYACRCDVARGGAPRPNWWTCHRAKAKNNGCPDDDVLLGRALCQTEGQRCSAPRVCGCHFFTEATCEAGRWVMPSCGLCLAP